MSSDHLDDERDSREEHRMILVVEQCRHAALEFLDQFGHLSNDAHRAQCTFLANVRVLVSEEFFHFVRQIACHIRTADVAQRCQCKTDDVGILVREISLQRIRHEHQHCTETETYGKHTEEAARQASRSKSAH
jgi:hypothetical protein